MAQPGVETQRILFDKRIFAAKEAVYKAQYAQSRHLFGYEALRISFDDARFSAGFQMLTCPLSHRPVDAEAHSVGGRAYRRGLRPAALAIADTLTCIYAPCPHRGKLSP